MTWLTDIIGNLFDLLVVLLGGSPLLVMLAVSVITAAWALLLFKAVTPQARLTATRNRLFGHIYEMGLYQDHLRVVGRIQGDLARANFRYLGLTLPALVVLTVPMVFTLAQLDSRFAHRPFQSGETTVLSLKLSAETDINLEDVTLETPAGLTVEAGPVKDGFSGALAWRLRAEDRGTHLLRILHGTTELATREVVVGNKLTPLGQSSRKDWLHGVFYPGAPPLDRDGSLDELTLRLPTRQTRYLGIEMHWLVAFMVFSLLSGLVMKDALRVSI
ncbi:MAG: hypothetical protein ABFS42_05555 [Candidatus Krumholzibacteriota bacterium]